MPTSVCLARYFWAAPCTALGLCAAAPAIAFGATAHAVDGVIEVALSGCEPPNALLGALPFNAITLGHVVIATTQAELDRLRAHEQAHVRQYELWGVFFLLAYPAAGFWQVLRGRRAYSDNWFEVQARSIAEMHPRKEHHGRGEPNDKLARKYGVPMRDDLSGLKPLDPGRINPMDPVELKYWCKELKCTESELSDAIAKVGEHVAELRPALASRDRSR